MLSMRHRPQANKEGFIMATRRALEKQAEIMNQEQRNLRSYLFYSAKDYWNRTSASSKDHQSVGSAVISGGTVLKRQSFLLSMLERSISSRIPTVIVADSGKMPGLADQIAEVMAGVQDTRLIVTSSQKRNYDFFQGWSIPDIITFLASYEECFGNSSVCDAVYLQNYFELVELVYGSVTLRVLMDADKTRDCSMEIIATLKRKLPDNPDPKTMEMLSYLRTTTIERDKCRTLLQKVWASLSAFQTNNPGYSLKTYLPKPGEIILFDVKDFKDPRFLTRYWEEELKSHNFLPFQLVICECANEHLVAWAKKYIKEGSSVTLCLQSMQAVLKGDTELPFRNMVFLFDQKYRTLPSNAEQELAILGQLDFWQVSEGGSSPPEAFSFWTGTHASLVAVKRNKVLPQDVGKHEAVLYGHGSSFSQNEIALVYKLLD